MEEICWNWKFQLWTVPKLLKIFYFSYLGSDEKYLHHKPNFHKCVLGIRKKPELETVGETNKFAVYCFCFFDLSHENAEATVSPARWRCICIRSSLLDERLLQDASSFIRLPTAGAAKGWSKPVISLWEEWMKKLQRGRKLCTYQCYVDNRDKNLHSGGGVMRVSQTWRLLFPSLAFQTW